MGGGLLECQVEVLWRDGVGVKGVVHGFRRVLRFLLWNFVFVGGIQKGESTYPVESMWEWSGRDWVMLGDDDRARRRGVVREVRRRGVGKICGGTKWRVKSGGGWGWSYRGIRREERGGMCFGRRWSEGLVWGGSGLGRWTSG